MIFRIFFVSLFLRPSQTLKTAYDAWMNARLLSSVILDYYGIAVGVLLSEAKLPIGFAYVYLHLQANFLFFSEKNPFFRL